MNIRKKRNQEALNENSQQIELFASVDEKNAKIKWLDNNGIEQIIATQTYVNSTSYIKPYKEYQAFITQSGTQDPVAQFFISDLEESITYNRENIGEYTITGENSNFIIGKTLLNHALLAYELDQECHANLSQSDENQLILKITDRDGTPVDEFAMYIYIKIYD